MKKLRFEFALTRRISNNLTKSKVVERNINSIVPTRLSLGCRKILLLQNGHPLDDWVKRCTLMFCKHLCIEERVGSSDFPLKNFPSARPGHLGISSETIPPFDKETSRSTTGFLFTDVTLKLFHWGLPFKSL